MVRWADINEAAAHLATTERHMRRLVHEREVDGFPVHRLGGKLRFDLDELDAWVKADGAPVTTARFGRRGAA